MFSFDQPMTSFENIYIQVIQVLLFDRAIYVVVVVVVGVKKILF